MDPEAETDQTTACSPLLFHSSDAASQRSRSNVMPSDSRRLSSSAEDMDLVMAEDGLINGTCETIVALHSPGDNDDMSDFSNSDLSLPEVCISTNSNSFEENMNYEVQMAYRIFTGFLSDKHKGVASPFLRPMGHQEAQRGIGGVCGQGQTQLKQSMCLKRMEEKFIRQEYETITEFVADFRLMLENCYRYHGVDHWISKQAQKLEIMLEQKLTLLSRTLREKTTLSVTSKGRFGAEEERSSGGTSTRRRLAPRSLATITVGGHESLMVQALRLEEQQRAKEEKRQRELEKREAEEMSAKEVEEWEQSLLSQAPPHTVDTLWELPAIGHFLCLAQTALNLPEIVFFELERCLLMPRCSILLSKIMSSLLSPWQKRASLHRRPALTYRRWESELRHRVMGWYRAVGSARYQPGRAELLGLCYQFFSILGEVSPLEEKPFHLLPFYQRVWLLKGLCDHVYETQKDVQDAVLAQPIHECRESILGYDSKENAYIHFPHFCGADLRIYCQSPSTPPAFLFPSVWVKRVEEEPGTEAEASDEMKREDTRECDDFGGGKPENLVFLKQENGDGEEEGEHFKMWSIKKKTSESGSSDEDSSEDSRSDLKSHANSHTSHIKGSSENSLKEASVTLKHEQGLSLGSLRTIKAETEEPCLSVGEHSYTGRSPARSVTVASPSKAPGIKMKEGSLSQGPQMSSCLECCESKTGDMHSVMRGCCCGTSGHATSSDSTQNSSEDRVTDQIWTKRKKWKRKRGRGQLPQGKRERKQLQHVAGMSLDQDEADKPAERRVATVKRKDKKKKQTTGKKLESAKKLKDEPPAAPTFKLVCTSLEELRELISRTEDELDDLESTKKKLGRWYYRREAVKDLHSTLIRLLNELSPWEPKLVKAYQRNRLRLKKEFDDFKKHPEYNNFVREECVSSSSSSDDEESRLGKEMCSLDHYRRSEEEDLDNRVPRGLWSAASTSEFVAECAGERTATFVTPNHQTHPLASTENSPLPRVQTGSGNVTPTMDSGLPSGSDVLPSNQSRDSNSANSTMPAQASVSKRPTILHPTTGLPKGYTPIPTLLAKSVGNKVTLMKRPADCSGIRDIDRQSKGSLVSLPTSTRAATKLSTPQSCTPAAQQNSQLQVRGQPTQIPRQPGMAAVMEELPQSPLDRSTPNPPKSPVQLVYKVPEGLGQLVRKDSSPVKISVHPVLDQKTGEKIMQQVVILPSNLLIHKSEETLSSTYQHQSKGIQVPVSRVESPLQMSTNVPGFTVPESRIPVQQVAPLKDARTVKSPSSSISPYRQQGALNTAGFKGAQVCSSQTSATQGIKPVPWSIKSPTSVAPTLAVKSTDSKQELKTVCIRDSQSILVTTRGGNTGIVKVQSSSDQNALGCVPASPVITISPEFKAFLISKTLQTSASVPMQSSCSTPAVTGISVDQPQTQVNSVLKTNAAVTNPVASALPGSIPMTGSESQTGIALSQGPNISAGSADDSKTVQLAQTGCNFQPSFVKSTFVPSLSTYVSQVLTPTESTSKTGLKRARTDETSQVTKFILVSPSSSSDSKEAQSSAKSPSRSTVLSVSRPTDTSSTTTNTKQGMATGTNDQLLPTSFSSQPVKTGLNQGQSVGSVNAEALSKVKNITVPAGLQMHLPGKTTTIGQTIGALSHSPCKSTSVSFSDTDRSPPPPTRLLPFTSSNTNTSSSAQPASHVTLTHNSPFQGVPSITNVSQPGSSTCTPASLTAANVTKKDANLTRGILPGNSTAQVITAMQRSPALTSIPLVCQPLNIQSSCSKEASSTLSSSHLGCNKNQTLIASATTNSSPLSTFATGTVQQRIVLNNSAPLAAGTHIFLNNARFVVPPQGLSPGNHVLIISSPTPQKVPSVSVTSTGSAVPPQGASHVAGASGVPQAPNGLPALKSALVACTTTVGPSLLATTPSATPVHLTGASCLGPTLLPSQTRGGSALPTWQTSQLSNFALPPISSGPAQVSPLITSAPGSALSTVRIATSTPTHAQCSSISSPAVTATLARFAAPSSATPSPPVIALPSPVIPSAPYLHSLPNQREISVNRGMQAQQTGGTTATSTAPSPSVAQMGLSNTSVKRQVPAIMQPVIAGPRTHVLPTVAVPPIVSTLSRIQKLPIATVPPIGTTVNIFETAPVVTTPPSSGTVLITVAQPVASLKANTTVQQPIVLTNSDVGVPSKLLVSPDGAVLSTGQCRVNAAEVAGCPKPLAALMVSPNSSNGALHTQDSSLQPSWANTK